MIKSDARKVLTDLRASLFFIIFFKRKELTTNAPSFAVRRQFLLLSRKRRGLEVARRIFLVQSQRNQWLSRFACTKGAADFRRLGAFSWCKANVINGFPGLLAPSLPPVSGGAAHFLGAKPTQSMAFPVCLHQRRRRFRAARCIFLVQSRRNQWLSRFACTKAAADFRRRGAFSWCKTYVINGFPGLLAPRPPISGGAAPVSAGAPAGRRATSSAAFPSPWCASGIPVSAFRLLPCASVLRFWASSPRNRRSPGALS